MAWQVGLMNYKNEMKKKSSRITYIEKFVQNKQIDVNIRKIVRHTLMTPAEPIGINKISKYFEQFIELSAPRKQVFKEVIH